MKTNIFSLKCWFNSFGNKNSGRQISYFLKYFLLQIGILYNTDGFCTPLAFIDERKRNMMLECISFRFDNSDDEILMNGLAVAANHLITWTYTHKAEQYIGQLTRKTFTNPTVCNNESVHWQSRMFAFCG